MRWRRSNAPEAMADHTMRHKGSCGVCNAAVPVAESRCPRCGARWTAADQSNVPVLCLFSALAIVLILGVMVLDDHTDLTVWVFMGLIAVGSLPFVTRMTRWTWVRQALHRPAP